MITERKGNKKFNVTIKATESLSEAIEIGEYKSGTLFIPDAWTAADIQILAAPDIGGPFVPLLVDGTAVNLDAIAVDTAHVLPAGVFVPFFIQLFSHNATVAAAQAAAVTIGVTLSI